MSETTYALERDLKEAEAMAQALIPYVYEDALYGTVGGRGLFGGGGMPSLTLGALLMRLRRLQALEAQMTESQRALLAEVVAQHESVRKEWTQHYNEKLTREASSRLKAMDTYFQECEEDRRICANAYLPEALRRTIVQEIVTAMEASDLSTADILKQARAVDSKLRRYSEPSEFVWAPELASIYPSGTFPWLYARPPQPNSKKDD